MKIASWIVGLYALLILVGGIIGYVKAGSAMSLVMGVVFGVLLLGAAGFLFKKKEMGLYGAFILSCLLDIFFGYRFAVTHHFLPAGLLSLLSLAMVIFLGLAIRKKIR